jgi:polar amino acid transport system ATP-binding protein
MSLLRFESVYKSYENEEVLKDVSFELDQQDVEVIIGPSGSGKSTLLRSINRLTEIDSGTIYLNDEDIHTLDENKLRRRVGMVFQDSNLFAHLTAKKNITLGLKKVLGLSADEAEEKAIEHLEQVGLADQRDSYPAELSGGQKQRVGIARALAMDPELILFDEPTSALDPELIAEVLSVMRDLAEQGTTMLCVTHQMDFARSVASRLTFLEDGEIRERGPPEQLFENPSHERTKQFLGELAEEY